MRLSSQLIGSIVGISILAQIVYGSVAYFIVLDDHKQMSNNLLTHIINKISTNWAPGEEAKQLYLEKMLKRFSSPNSVLLMQDRDGKIYITENHDLSLGLTSNLFDRDKELESGALEINDNVYHLAKVTLPADQGQLILLNLEDEIANRSYAKLSARLLTTSIIIIWLAIWIALILSSIISKKLEKKNQELRYQSLHDGLTDLPNRTSLIDYLNQAQLISDREQNEFALLVMDLDNFKEVNDTLGHNIGDQLLLDISHSIQQTLRKNDILSRLGGDEFAILLPATNMEGAKTCVTKILDRLNQPHYIGQTNINCKLSIGIALYPQHGEGPKVLLQHADIAMYQAKQNKNGYAIYDPKLNPHSIKKLQLMSDLREAVEQGQLDVYYQPMIDQYSVCTIGAEALVRWNHPRSGFIAPDDFIPIAERTGLIKQLTIIVLKKAIRSCKQWHDQGHEMTVSINISAHCLQDSTFTDQLNEIIQSTQLPASKVELEITESTLMHNMDSAKTMLQKLHEIGFKISIDDFGTGFSSLAYLRELPVDTLKIDKSFVLDMNSSESNATIVKTIIELAHNLNYSVVAEGVEDEQTLKHLGSLRNDVAQGYYFSKPLPGIEFNQWLENSTWKSKQRSDYNGNDFDASKPAHRVK